MAAKLVDGVEVCAPLTSLAAMASKLGESGRHGVETGGQKEGGVAKDRR